MKCKTCKTDISHRRRGTIYCGKNCRYADTTGYNRAVQKKQDEYDEFNILRTSIGLDPVSMKEFKRINNEI